VSGIYVHIPFCRQACHYCNFHFATSLLRKEDLLESLHKEIELRKDYLSGEKIETVYFGGGTPSLLEADELDLLLKTIRSSFSIHPGAEITLEANPDDITESNLKDWKEAGINRLSIGVQSFFDEDLVWMNRAHSARQAVDSLKSAAREFENFTIDLIYGYPLLNDQKWKQNVDRAIAYGVPHISGYALTVEPRTPLDKMIRTNKTMSMDPEKQSSQFLLLMDWMEATGYEHYEISNFAKPGWRSRHNSAYWSTGIGGKPKKYIGIGPSAHSFDGSTRQWNVANNNIYITGITNGNIPCESENLSAGQRLNEYIMTSLRTREGLDLGVLDSQQEMQLRSAAKKYIDNNLLKEIDKAFVLTREGKLMADGIAAALFF
jgi:oxygen-independent coproporphyrinogen III oxidase